MRHVRWHVLILAVLLTAVLLAGCAGGPTQPQQTLSPEAAQQPLVQEEPDTQEEPEVSQETTESAPPPQETPGTPPEETTSPEDAQAQSELVCTISISCAAVLSNMDQLDPDKVELIPSDGWVLPETQVVFEPGESAFALLQRICRENAIHMESENTALYDSAYISGINNLYEFDCGPLSGWMFEVNGWFPNYSCSLYTLQDGDNVSWVYTCQLGEDIGAGAFTPDA